MSRQAQPAAGAVPDGVEITDQDRIVQHLRHRVLEQITGSSGERVRTDFPRDRFFAGPLAPDGTGEFDDFDDDLQSKMKPSGLGATVQVDPDDDSDTLGVEITGAVWIRVNPTYEELRNSDDFVSLGDREEEAEPVEDDDGDNPDLIEVFERFELRVPEIEIPLDLLMEGRRETPEHVDEASREAIRTAFEDVRQEAMSREDISVFRITEGGVPDSALESEDAYQEYLENRTGEPAIPQWNAELDVTAERNDDGTLLVDFEFVNMADILAAERWQTLRDPTLFEVTLDLTLEGDSEFVPITFDPLPEDFRYNRDLWGHGRNCTVVSPDSDVAADGRPPGRRAPPESPRSSHLRTEYIPQYQQFVYRTADRGIEPRFDVLMDLENGGFELLRAIADEMEDYRDNRYDEALEEYRARDDWNEGFLGRGGRDEEEFERDKLKFDREITRFNRGVDCLEAHPETVGRAFEYMNETMKEMHDFESWHLFQLVFIVMLIPDIASREYDEFAAATWREEGELEEETPVEVEDAMDVVDVLWFPTGGGKTEAFLGVAVWSAFFDRLRGKDFGVTAWTRFPLRLLSMQQLQRMAETMMWADIVRRRVEEIDANPSRCFSVGFMVGKRNTPNALSGFGNNTASELRNDPQRLQNTKVLPKCPVCGAPTEMKVTRDLRLAHICTASAFDCEWQQRDIDPHTPYGEEELPVHIVDNELYRYAPTILAGTIDKITAIGYQRKMAHIISGQMDCECPVHGFSSLEECTEKYGCDIDKDDFADMATPVEPYDAAPSLEVPDELHLLEESVGSFDGHYETAVQELQELENAGKTKVLAPTATITAFEDQVYHLFLRAAERFPAPGPFLRENFYAEEKPRLQRYYLGITPHGKTHINAILDLLYHYHRAIQDLLEVAVHDPEAIISGEALDPPEIAGELAVETAPELLELLGNYTTSLTYLLSRKDGDRLDQSIESQLANYFQTEDRPALNPNRMTGGTQFEEIQEILDELESPWNAETDEALLDGLVEQGVVREEDVEDILALRDTAEACLKDGADPERYHEALEATSEEGKTGFAWLLSYRTNTITATSMISHGVDVERFNMMTFFGMPRQTAEYIQSSSRAGRTHPGMIFNVFHPIRERDQSHYHFFEKYHEFLDRLVEPVAINRWAKNSVKRTHPGLFMALLLNHYMYSEGAGRLFFGNQAEKLVQSVDDVELDGIIRAMYGGDLVPSEFAANADGLTGQSVSQIQLTNDKKWTSDRLRGSVMTSLRDVDKQLPIRPTWKAKDLMRAFEGGD